MMGRPRCREFTPTPRHRLFRTTLTGTGSAQGLCNVQLYAHPAEISRAGRRCHPILASAIPIVVVQGYSRAVGGGRLCGAVFATNHGIGTR